MNFSDLPPILGEALAERGYDTPTEVQSAVIAPEASGRDLVVSAQTGSGKTVAFGLAMAEQMLAADGKVPFGVAPLALVIAPTRELALQVSRELIWLYGKAGARIATCVGGMDASKERRNLRGGAQIVVGTPGRLRDHLERGALDLSALKVAVLDEADEMLDMGFREDLEEILDATPEGRRTLLFSATMPKPIVALAKRYQQDALRISTVGDTRGHGDIEYQAVTIAHCSIAGNTAGFSAGGLYYAAPETAGPESARLVNSIVWGNTADNNNPQIETSVFGFDVVDPVELQVIRSSIAGGCTDSATITCTDVLSESPLFVNLGAGDLHLGPGSTLVDAGDDGLIPPDLADLDDDGDVDEPTPLDLDALPRIAGAAVDLGALEQP